MKLDGDGYALRPWQRGDETALVQHANDRDVWRNLRDLFPHPYTLDDATTWIELVGQRGDELVHNFAIVVGGAPVGGAGFDPLTDVHRRCAEIGYWLGRAHWGRGLATKVVKQLTDYAFTRFDLVRLQAHVFAWNPASARVLVKAGYVHEARHARSAFKDGTLVDEDLFVRLRADIAPPT